MVQFLLPNKLEIEVTHKNLHYKFSDFLRKTKLVVL